MGGFLKDILETAGSIWVQGETVKAQSQNAGNSADDFDPVTTGVDHTGNTLWIDRPLVAGVSNGAVLAGLATILVVGLAAYMVTND